MIRTPRLFLPLLLCVAIGVARTSAAQENPTAQNPVVPDAGQAPSLEQEQAAVQNQVVPLQDEPHHRLLLHNEFVRVYTLGISPNDATLIHRHDLPYVAVNFGAADIVDIVQGKSEAHLKLQDGQVTYAAGGFTHVLRADSSSAVRNVMIELVRPQGTARNLCKPVIDGPLDCPEQARAQEQNTTEANAADAQAKKPARGAKSAHRGTVETTALAAKPVESADASKRTHGRADDDVRYFETDEIQVDVITVSQGRDYVEATPQRNALLVALSNADLEVTRAGQHISFLHDGDMLWLPAGEPRNVSDFLGTRSSFLLVSFKDSDTAAKP
jgi:hypothetical protein